MATPPPPPLTVEPRRADSREGSVPSSLVLGPNGVANPLPNSSGASSPIGLLGVGAGGMQLKKGSLWGNKEPGRETPPPPPLGVVGQSLSDGPTPRSGSNGGIRPPESPTA